MRMTEEELTERERAALEEAKRWARRALVMNTRAAAAMCLMAGDYDGAERELAAARALDGKPRRPAR